MQPLSSTANSNKNALRFLSVLLLVLAGLIFSNAVLAHPARDSAVFIDVLKGQVDMELHLPVDQLYSVEPSIFPRGHTVDDFEQALEVFSVLDTQVLGDYLVKRISVQTPGRSDAQNEGALTWQFQLNNARVEPHLNELGLIANLSFSPSDARYGNFGDIFIHYDAIVDRIVNHKALVTLRRDFDMGVLPEHAIILPSVHRNNKDIVINRENASAVHGSLALFHDGVVHILEGTDHILFLLCLLLAAPMVVSAGVWRSAPTSVRVFKRGLLLVSAFTLGHTLMFFLASLDVIRLPSQLVEIAVAATIMISAANLIFPFIKDNLIWLAGLFGLVHGLAFATSLSVLGFSGAVKILTLVSFTLGIEAVQAAILLLTLPALVELSRHRFFLYRGFLLITAPLIFLAGLLWAMQRMQLLAELPMGNLDDLNQLMPYALALLWLGAGVSYVLRWLKPTTNQVAEN